MLKNYFLLFLFSTLVLASGKPDFYNFLGKQESYLVSQKGKPEIKKPLKSSIAYIYNDNDSESTSFAVQEGVVKAVIKSYTDKTYPASANSRTKFINYCIMKGFKKASDNKGSVVYKLDNISIIISPVSPNAGSGFSFQAVAM
ncbi:MAG: hypothetical protein Q8903_01410 [Bacteroidota bacterium]|nr:hypothetical protein [Bacteroidota bacterium]